MPYHGRSISPNAASLNILAHDAINFILWTVRREGKIFLKLFFIKSSIQFNVSVLGQLLCRLTVGTALVTQGIIQARGKPHAPSTSFIAF